MKIEDIEIMWAKDSEIDEHSLASESLRGPSLHHRYYQLYIREKLQLAKLNEQLNSLESLLTDFFAKNLTDDELEEHGLVYSDKKVLRPDIPQAVRSHKMMFDHKLKIAMCSEKADYLKSILQQINNRGFTIKNAIDFKKFQAGN